MNSLRLEYYRTAFLSITRSKRNGIYNNAKPILLLTCINRIEQQRIKDNKIYFDKELEFEYNNTYATFFQGMSTPPIVYPYYHLKSDDFWNLKVKNVDKFPHTPSPSFLHKHVEYASFDNALWDLLCDEDCRTFLKELLIKTYLAHACKRCPTQSKDSQV